MNIFKRLLASLEARLSQPRLSIWRTLYFNFRTLPFSTAIKLPVFIDGPVRLFILIGKVKFENTEIRRGMVKIGKNTESFSLCDHSGFIQLASTQSELVFRGPCKLSVNTKIRVVGDASLTVGDKVFIGADVRIICNGGKVSIGDYSRIAFETVIMNSSFHHVYNSSKQCFGRTTRPVSIGEACWIGNRSSIAAGAVLKPHTIVAAGSIINKNFAKLDGEYMLLGGAPAKMIGTGFKRIFSPHYEQQVEKWFAAHPEENSMPWENFQDDIQAIKSEF